MSGRKTLASFLLILVCTPLQAGERQQLNEIVQTVEQFIRQSTRNSGNEITVNVTQPDSRLRLPRCDSLEAWLPSGNKPWGRTSVGVRCRSPVSWSIYVPVMVKVAGPALVATRPIAKGQVVEREDIQTQTRDLTPYPGGVLNHPDQAVGKTAATMIRAGDLLRPELLRAALVVRQGQQVTLVAQGAGFRVSSEGTALGNATSGQVVSVKTRSGQTIKGIARSEGVVEVYF
ncbi:MAG: flagellar basal body P-ring formation chaperone FlgA [Methylophilaceae bacterium]|nr:flagellar basal body P-ring formation chaperone FlgA [Methylophilaceae bacterium]